MKNIFFVFSLFSAPLRFIFLASQIPLFARNLIMKILSQEFYIQDDVVQLSRDLLGKFLMTNLEGDITGGMIIETEAYRGPEDKASHAYGNRRTKRTEAMFQKGGICYVYLCYGMHNLFNIVTNIEGTPHAILVRAIWPTDGIENMLHRRKKTNVDSTLANGPGTVTQALGIDTSHNGMLLTKQSIWVEDRGIKIHSKNIAVGPRIGIDYAKEDALLPWRFRLKKERKNNIMTFF
ncbi:MAG: putative 3-methyladenine DNA glycosylase [Chlamydiae bacterium]|nr:putative 3-methyladenine DNA glycosylase [Chlamydiota bacterium]